MQTIEIPLKKRNVYTPPTWQDVIDFAERVIGELEPLVEDDKQNIILLMFMNKAIGLKHHAIVEQMKEQEQHA